MQLVLRAIALISFIVAIVWWFVLPGFEPLSAVLVGLLTLLTSFIVEKSQGERETLDERNRRLMLDHVENSWIKGILDASLHDAVLLELGMKEERSAVYPWRIKKESTNETLPAGKSMLEIFLEIGRGRSLLILGAPGSGKTTMLLELTRRLIGRAREDKTEPIPVVFNLASWTEKQSLADWLAEQLNLIYTVPRKIAPSWVQGNKMLLLLDGLDEVREESRAKCVEAINQFRKEYGLTSLVVCSRIAEYTAVNKKLSFEGAITIQPLTSEQISVYVDHFGNRLASLRLSLREDNALQELAETPLMLSIMTLAYKDLKVDELLASPEVEDRRRHIFSTYIDRMFERSTRSANSLFTKRQTLDYLRWLAQMMIQHNLTAYQIEAMQPAWLKAKSRVYLFRSMVGLISGLILTLLFSLLGIINVELGTGLFSRLGMKNINALLWGLPFALAATIALLLLSDEITMVDRLKWSWTGMRTGALVGLLIAPIGGLMFGLLIDPSVGLGVGLIGVILIPLVVGLFLGTNKLQIEETTYPGQGLRKTLANMIYFALLFVPIGGMFNGVSGGLGFWLSIGLGTRLLIGLIVGTILAAVIGIALIQHFILRLMLAMQGLLPWRLIPFLEYAVNLIFLRRVGGSYIFVHRLLMEHFAEMEG